MVASRESDDQWPGENESRRNTHRSADPDPDSDFVARSGDASPPMSPAKRRLAGLIALIFIGVIIVFLVWFVATNTERREAGGLFSVSSHETMPERLGSVRDGIEARELTAVPSTAGHAASGAESQATTALSVAGARTPERTTAAASEPGSGRAYR